MASDTRRRASKRPFFAVVQNWGNSGPFFWIQIWIEVIMAVGVSDVPVSPAAGFARLPSLSDMAKCVDLLESMDIRVKSGKAANEDTEASTRSLLAAQSEWLGVAMATRMADVLQPLARFCQVCGPTTRTHHPARMDNSTYDMCSRKVQSPLTVQMNWPAEALVPYLHSSPRPWLRMCGSISCRPCGPASPQTHRCGNVAPKLLLPLPSSRTSLARRLVSAFVNTPLPP